MTKKPVTEPAITIHSCSAMSPVKDMSIEDSVNQLVTATDIHSIERICLQLCRQYDFQFYTCFFKFQLSEHEPHYLVLRDKDSEWIQHYDQQQFLLVDPSIRFSQVSVKPFIWSAKEYSQLKEEYPINVREKAMIDTAIAFDVTRSFNAPFHEHNGSYGVIRFVNEMNRRPLSSMSHLTGGSIGELFWISSHIYEACSRVYQNGLLSSRETHREGSQVLSLREIEVLTCLSLGYSPTLVADQLTVSENTIRKHLTNIRKKLGAKNTVHAVSKAMSQGMIPFA